MGFNSRILEDFKTPVQKTTKTNLYITHHPLRKLYVLKEDSPNKVFQDS